jgi:NAD(P)-dependent dehydrogenase (short-subunit alcohol dehydrogenase family)
VCRLIAIGSDVTKFRVGDIGSVGCMAFSVIAGTGDEKPNEEPKWNYVMNNPLDFSGKVTLVTGAASGMGLATAQAFAEAGADIVLADFKEEAVKAAAQKLVAAGHKAIAVGCDVSDEAQVAAMVDRTVAEFGRLDAAFNNAGVMARIAPIADSSREDWDRVIGINLRGVWSCMKYELRQMERQGSGAIVNNASVGALTGNPGIASYIASKHGVVGLTRTAALEYVKRGIRVNAVNPGLIDTQIARDVVNGDVQAYAELAKDVPIGRAGQPEEIASVVLWLCSPGASYVVGHALTVDGGMTVP